MQNDEQQYSIVSQFTTGQDFTTTCSANSNWQNADVKELLAQMIAAQNRQNELLEKIVTHLGAAQRQRAQELANWKKTNPKLVASCNLAAQQLSKVQLEYLTTMTDEIGDNYEELMENEYGLSDLLDRFGPRFMHLNILLQLLVQLGGSPEIQKNNN